MHHQRLRPFFDPFNELQNKILDSLSLFGSTSPAAART